MEQGWIKLNRKIRDHWLYKEKRVFSKLEAWLELLMMVNFQDNKVLIDGVLINVSRGSIITSLRQLANNWGWSITKVKNFLVLLEKEEMVIVKTDSKKTVLSIVNYDTYQDKDNSQVTEKGQAKDKEMTGKETEKNVKKEKNEKNEKNYSSQALFDPCDLKFAKKLLKKLQTNNPKIKEPALEEWAQAFFTMRQTDRRSMEQITFLINWTQSHYYWKTIILSPFILREKFALLQSHVREEQEKQRQAILRKESFTYR